MVGKEVFEGLNHDALLDRLDIGKMTAIYHRFLSPFYFTSYVTGYNLL